MHDVSPEITIDMEMTEIVFEAGTAAEVFIVVAETAFTEKLFGKHILNLHFLLVK